MHSGHQVRVKKQYLKDLIFKKLKIHCINNMFYKKNKIKYKIVLFKSVTNLVIIKRRFIKSNNFQNFRKCTHEKNIIAGSLIATYKRINPLLSRPVFVQ